MTRIKVFNFIKDVDLYFEDNNIEYIDLKINNNITYNYDGSFYDKYTEYILIFKFKKESE